jgi:hypothetical protein
MPVYRGPILAEGKLGHSFLIKASSKSYAMRALPQEPCLLIHDCPLDRRSDWVIETGPGPLIHDAKSPVSFAQNTVLGWLLSMAGAL